MVLPAEYVELLRTTRLTTETIANDLNSANNGALNYSLDAVGNRLVRTSTLAAIPSMTASYDANDRLNSDGYDAKRQHHRGPRELQFQLREPPLRVQLTQRNSTS